MKLLEYQKSKSFYGLGERSLRFQNLILFYSNTVWSFATRFHMKAYGINGMKVYIHNEGHMTKMADTLTWSKPLLICIIVGQEPTTLAVGAGGDVLSSIMSLLFLPVSRKRPDLERNTVSNYCSLKCI